MVTNKNLIYKIKLLHDKEIITPIKQEIQQIKTRNTASRKLQHKTAALAKERQL
jgi:hypothetical protein